MGARVKLIENGPAIVTGIEESPVVTLELEDESVKESKVIAICRCGKSKNYPFCDGKHLEK